MSKVAPKDIFGLKFTSHKVVGAFIVSFLLVALTLGSWGSIIFLIVAPIAGGPLWLLLLIPVAAYLGIVAGRLTNLSMDRLDDLL